MARASVEQKLQQLDDVSPTDGATFTTALKKALSDKHYRVIAKAARLCQAHNLDQYRPELIAAYAHLQLNDALKKDPRCYAKTVICEVLYDLNYDKQDFYLAGLRYHQMEPAWGGFVDSGLDIRRICALGLTLTRCPRMNIELLTVLYDEAASVRAGAVAAIACLPVSIAEPMLRQKILGEDEAWVLGDCFTALLKLEPDQSVDFVGSFLHHGDETLIEYAALALGESRLDDAFVTLQQAWVSGVPEPMYHMMLLRGIVLHRSEAAYAFILDVIRTNDHALALDALEQLAIYRANVNLKQQVQTLVSDMQRADLTDLFERAWA